MSWMISLSAQTDETPDADRLYWSLCDLARDLRGEPEVNYVSVSSSKTDLPDVDTEPEEYHDENTLNKVRHAINDALVQIIKNPEEGSVGKDIDIIITSMQNYGILFRERR
jgi:hypothetical protein